ncbi:MAG: hypothetical protein ACFFD2_04995 [Promethearchaeota archaeon]
MDLTTDLAGIRLRNSTMLSSGILGISSSLLKRIYETGVGYVVTKSIGPNPRNVFPNQCIVEATGGYINAMGLPNPGIKAFLEEIDELNQMNISIIVSIFGDEEK